MERVEMATAKDQRDIPMTLNIKTIKFAINIADFYCQTIKI